MSFLTKLNKKWNARPAETAGFKGFSLKQKFTIVFCCVIASISFVLSIVAIANPNASTNGSAAQEYAFVGGLIGLVFSLLLTAYAMYVDWRAKKRRIKHQRLWDWMAVALVFLALLFSLTAASVAR